MFIPSESELLESGGEAATTVLTWTVINIVHAEDLGEKGMAEGVDTIACHTLTKERQPQGVSELLYLQTN